MSATTLQRNQLTIFVTAWISYALMYFLRKPIGVIKPILENEFSLNKTKLGFMDVSFLLPYALIQLFGSSVADKLGSRLTIALCLTSCGTVMFSFGLWNSYIMLLIAMSLNGLFQGPMWPALCKSVCAWYPDLRLNSVVGFLSTSVFVGGFLGTAAAVKLQTLYGWRFVHLPSALVSAGTGLLVFCVLHTPEEKRIYVPGKEHTPLKIVDDKINTRKPFMEMWRLPCVCEISLTVLCLKIIRYVMYMWLPMYLVQYLQYSVATAGMFSTIFDIGGALGSPLIGLVLDRKFKKNTLLGMWMFITASSISIVLFAMTAHLGWVHNAVFMFIAGATNGGCDSLLAGSVSMKIGEANGLNAGAQVTGLVNGFGTFGAVVEGPLVGYLSDRYGWAAMLILMIVLSAMSSLTVLRAMFLQRRLEKSTIPDTESKVPLIT